MKQFRKTAVLAQRTLKEMLRDPLTLFFGLAFPILILLLLSLIQSHIPVDMFRIEQLAPGIVVFGQSFLSLFGALLIARDRSTSFLMRLYAAPVTGLSFLQNNQASQMLTQLYSDMGVDLAQTFGSLDRAGLYMLINAGGCLVAGVLLLLVYTTRQPKFLLVQLGGSALAGIALAVLVGVNLVCLAVVVCACVTLLLLRRQLPRRKG